MSIRGIDLRLHLTFPFILAWAALQFGLLFGSLSGALFGVVAVTILFGLVTLHELGHSFAAQFYGVPVKQIILTPIGGMAQLDRMPEKPLQELVIAIAGPAVNVVIAILMLAVAIAAGIDSSTLLSASAGLAGVTLVALFSYVFISNIFLAIFNLLPAFPMDGGRILRALLAFRLDYARATNIAAGLGRVIAVLLGIYGLISGSFFLLLIAVFIYSAATQEARATQVGHILRRHTVQQAFSTSAYRLQSTYTIQQAANMAAYSGQQSFAVVSGDELVGFLPHSLLRAALRTYPSYTPVTDVMLQNIRPVTADSDLFAVQQRLLREKLDALPVVNESGRFLGLITLRQIIDLYRLAQSEPPIVQGPQSV
jgi:stage IV sporulation protein FB